MIQVKVTKRFQFEAAHNLENYQGACERLHGHSYKLEVTIVGPMNDKQLVVDFKDVKAIVQEMIINEVDHQELNVVMVDNFSLQGNTTCENMLTAFWWKLDHEITEKFGAETKLWELKLWETEDSHATITRPMIYGGHLV